MGLTLLAEWAKLAEEKGKLQNLVERNGLGAQLEEAKMDEIRTAREVAETAKEYGEQNETLRGEVQNLLKKSAFSASVMMNFLATEAVDLDGPDSPGVDEVSPVNYQGESIELTPRQQRVTNAMLKQVTTAAYGVGTMTTGLAKTKKELVSKFVDKFKVSLQLIFWHYRRIIIARPSIRAEMMHLELSLRARHYVEALQVALKLLKDDAKSFELAANAIKELGGIHNCPDCPEIKVWNYFFDILTAQHSTAEFPPEAAEKVKENGKLKEALLVELKEQREKSRSMDEFLRVMCRKVARTKVKMNTI